MGPWALNCAKGIPTLTNETSYSTYEILDKLDTGVSIRSMKPGKRCSGSYSRYVNKHGFFHIVPPVPVSKGHVRRTQRP